jgi:heme-degrading monooxygenase HmoA
MYLRETRYNGLPPERIDSTVEAIQEQLPVVTDRPGFRDAYVIVDRDAGRVSCLTLWRSEDAMRNSEAIAADGLARAVKKGTGDWRERPLVERYQVVDYRVPSNVA